jgi:hypothetical protein
MAPLAAPGRRGRPGAPQPIEHRDRRAGRDRADQRLVVMAARRPASQRPGSAPARSSASATSARRAAIAIASTGSPRRS